MRTEVRPAAPGTGASWRPRRVEIGSNGSAASAAALRSAHAIARRGGASSELVTAFAPRIPCPPGWEGRRIRCEQGDRGDALDLVRRVRRQRANALPRGARCATRLEIGEAARAVQDRAASRNADLVVVGLGRQQPEHRRTGGGVTRRLAMLTDRPLLAVAADAPSEPSSALIVLQPEEPDDERLLVIALGVLGRPARVWIARIGSDAEIPIPDAAVNQLAEEGSTIERLLLPDPSHDRVLALADELEVDLIAARIHGGDATVRRLVPNLALLLLADAERSVLAVPVTV